MRAVPNTAGSVGPGWKKSSLSAHNGNCVEVARLRSGNYGVRHSKDKDGGGRVLTFTYEEWETFIGVSQQGRFDPPRAWEDRSCCFS